MTIYTSTDIDGDTLTIERNDGVVTATISGEDGHRTVIIDDLAALAAALTAQLSDNLA